MNTLYRLKFEIEPGFMGAPVPMPKVEARPLGELWLGGRDQLKESKGSSMKLEMRGLLALLMAGFCMTATAAVDVVGGTDAAPTDVTALLLVNQDINFTGGHYVVKLPQSGSSLVTPQSVDPTLIRYGNNGFSSNTNPTIHYRGVISGNGSLTVRSGFNAQRPGYGEPFSGGALIFSNQGGQTWGLDGVAPGGRSPSALTIESNATVAFFFPGSVDNSAGAAPLGEAFNGTTAGKDRNVTNHGYLYSSAQNSWGSITGTGVNVFQYWGGDRGRLPGGSIYSGQAFVFNSGLQIHRGAIFEDQADGQPTTHVSSDITVFQNGIGQWLTIPSSFKIGDLVNLIPNNIYMFSLNLQLWGRGIHQFIGMLLPPTGSKNHLELAPINAALPGLYHYGQGSNQAFGRVINLTNRMTFLMGDGREVVTNPDGVTNNTFLQGNPFNSLLSTANFEPGPAGDQNQAMAYNYSGTYRVNTNFNAAVDGKAGIVQRIRNDDWVHLLFLDPKAWNPAATKPNHAIVTVPVFLAGLTRIDTNAVLQLGDGTTGNYVLRKQLSANGFTETSDYNDSMGNGMLMTKGNEAMLPKGAGREAMNAKVNFQIVNNGKLIVNNTPGALSATVSDGTRPGSAPEVAAWMMANRLDGISGRGSVEQMGRLPLTLGSAQGNSNTYTGGTMVHAGATLIVSGADALGDTTPGVIGSGQVRNQGTLKAAPGTRRIIVRGDYLQ